MSEKIQQHGGEQYHPRHEHKEAIERQAELKGEVEQRAAEAQRNPNNTQELAQKVEKYAISGKEYSPAEQQNAKDHPVLINKKLKEMEYQRRLLRTRKQLHAPSRAFSKFTHNPVVDKVSESVGKTVARPSSMLGGAFVAAAGSLALFLITKHQGYEYNYLAMILLFAGGMILGVAIEGLLKLVKKS